MLSACFSAEAAEHNVTIPGASSARLSVKGLSESTVRTKLIAYLLLLPTSIMIITAALLVTKISPESAIQPKSGASPNLRMLDPYKIILHWTDTKCHQHNPLGLSPVIFQT